MIRVSVRSHLDALLRKHGYLRATYEGDYLAMWDGKKATHRNYEDQLGGVGGWRLEFSGSPEKGYTIGYNAYDCTMTEIKRSALFRRLFTPDEMKAACFIANDV